MTDPAEIADAIADTLSESTDPRAELVALGMVVSGVICTVAQEDRADLVETFCKVLRGSVAMELHS